MTLENAIRISIVATIYKTGRYLEEFTRRSFDAALGLGFKTDEIEIILVNDGCPGGGLEAALAVREKDKRVRVVDLSRNFGHHRAMMTGLRHTRGELVYLLDSDLEESPEWLAEFYPKMLESHSDVVYGVQETRKGNIFERLSGEFFYTIFNFLASPKIIPNTVTARLMSRRYVDALASYTESESFLFGLAALTGFEQEALKVKKLSSSPSSYSLKRKLMLACNSVISFSSRPLIGIALLGLVMTACSFLYVMWLVIRRVFYTEAPEGWTTLAVSIWFVGGCIILCLGVVSMYIAKIFSEVKRRPNVIVRKVYE